MTLNLIIKELEESHAVLHGHFVLSSGLHSGTYIQCAKIFEYPERAVRLCTMLVDKIKSALHDKVDLILSPAIGGIIVGYEIGRQLNLRTMFCERVSGNFKLRRGFEIEQGNKILLVEDVITTGKSSLEAVKCAEAQGGHIVAEAALIQRKSKIKMPFPIIPLIELNINDYNETDVPDTLKKLPISKPGSREYLRGNT
ncbi:orotate phosphoribosyltransferase [Wolbachia pipientis]|uniref:Orotate phosphoribosyltransferase n=1 Tax=Wolbachia pipientis TaxID=955 RepID=A0A1E7QJF8_WOLPI|nr:orotate phosphoribosyltransferase [Wolbachia pipientis]OEY86600.1 orotate phosphoribosyltransferase [Wolbachia pipientis]